MLKRHIILILFLLSLCFCYSQKNAPSPEDISKATALKETYPDEDLVVTNSYQEISFGFNSKLKKVTVNTTDKETLLNISSRADIQKACFYSGESQISQFIVRDKKGRKVKNYIKDQGYVSEGLFHNDTRVKFTNISFPLKGYSFTTFVETNYFDIKYFPQLFFSDIYPIQHKEVKIVIPNWLNVELKEINFKSYRIEKEIIEGDDEKIYTYTVKDIPATFKEKNVPGPTHLYPHILFLAKSHDKNGTSERIFESTQDLYRWYKTLTSDLTYDKKLIADKVKAITSPYKDDNEQIKAIYYWAQDNIRYIAFEDGIAGFKPDRADHVFNKKYGDCKGMANLLKAMLIEAGFDARLTWIGTKRIAYDYSTPSLAVDNHMICSLVKDGEIIFLDGTEKFNSLGEYANRIQGKQVLIENGENYLLETVPEVRADFNKNTNHYELKIEDGALTGTAKKIFTGESRSGMLYFLNNGMKNNEKEDFLDYYLSKGNDNVIVSNITSSSFENRDIPLEFSYGIKIENAVSNFDNQIFIDLEIDREFYNFTIKERDFDYMFRYKKHIESTTTLAIPENYKILEIPDNLSLKTEGYEFNITFESTDSEITYKKSFSINQDVIKTLDFDDWNNIIEKISDVYNQQIILNK